jgi:hypothetical protein
MRKFTSLFLAIAICVVSSISETASAGPENSKARNKQADSVVACFGGVGTSMGVYTFATPPHKDAEACIHDQGGCSRCIDSLLNQGCEITSITSEYVPQIGSQLPDRSMMNSATYLLSCNGR